MRRTGIVLGVLFLLVFAGAGYAADPIRIGHTVSLTGGASMWGQSEANALDMLVKKINAEGGLLGRPIEFVRYDNRNDAVETVNVAKRLVSAHSYRFAPQLRRKQQFYTRVARVDIGMQYDSIHTSYYNSLYGFVKPQLYPNKIFSSDATSSTTITAPADSSSPGSEYP